MKNISQINTITAAALIALLAQQAWAQPGVSPYYKSPESFSGKTIVIPAGTTFEGRIESDIGSAISKQGQRFTISLSSPLLANGSDVLIPAGAQVLGEVVQAIPANTVPHAKKEKPVGKLRVEITALKMPNGMTYPMVASLIGEETVSNSPYGYNPYGRSSSPVRGSGVAYMGSTTGFESIAPGKARYTRNGAPSVVTKNEMLNDPIMGRDRDMNGEKTEIRSLVKKKRNLYIYNGSPLTIRLEAPFKIGMGSSAAQESTYGLPPTFSESLPSAATQQRQPATTQQAPVKTSPKSPQTRNVRENNSQDSNF